MKIAFMGTPDFAEASLRALISAGHDVISAYCQPDKPGNRMKTIPCPVKSAALEFGIPIFQPASLKTPETLEEFLSLGAEILVVVAYGKILPDGFIFAPKYGSINLHGSLLPKYRGSAPIQRAVLNGDTTTGVSTQYLMPEVDSGDVIFSESVIIGELETAGELYSRLKFIGAELLVKTVRAIERGEAPGKPQDPSEITFAKPLSKDMSPIDWQKSPREIIKHICGLNPWPMATAIIAGHAMRILMAEYTDIITGAIPGDILAADSRGIIIACGNSGAIRIISLQPAGKKPMSAADYLRGHPIAITK